VFRSVTLRERRRQSRLAASHGFLPFECNLALVAPPQRMPAHAESFCEKNRGVEHDFEEGEWVFAQGWVYDEAESVALDQVKTWVIVAAHGEPYVVFVHEADYFRRIDVVERTFGGAGRKQRHVLYAYDGAVKSCPGLGHPLEVGRHSSGIVFGLFRVDERKAPHAFDVNVLFGSGEYGVEQFRLRIVVARDRDDVAFQSANDIMHLFEIPEGGGTVRLVEQVAENERDVGGNGLIHMLRCPGKQFEASSHRPFRMFKVVAFREMHIA